MTSLHIIIITNVSYLETGAEEEEYLNDPSFIFLQLFHNTVTISPPLLLSSNEVNYNIMYTANSDVIYTGH